MAPKLGKGRAAAAAAAVGGGRNTNNKTSSRSPRSVMMNTTAAATTSSASTTTTSTDDSTLVGMRYSMGAGQQQHQQPQSVLPQISSNSSESSLSLSTFGQGDQSTIATNDHRDDISSFALYDDISHFAHSLGSTSTSNKVGPGVRHGTNGFEVSRRSSRTAISKLTTSTNGGGSGGGGGIHAVDSTASSSFGYSVSTATTMSEDYDDEEEDDPFLFDDNGGGGGGGGIGATAAGIGSFGGFDDVDEEYDDDDNNNGGGMDSSPSRQSLGSGGSQSRSSGGSGVENSNKSSGKTSGTRGRTQGTGRSRKGDNGTTTKSSGGGGGGEQVSRVFHPTMPGGGRASSGGAGGLANAYELRPTTSNMSASGTNETERHKHGLASRKLQKGQLDEALKLFQEILASQRDIHGNLHRSVGAALHNVGVVHIKAKRMKEALPIFQEAVMIRKKTLGFIHKDVASSLTKLGSVHMSLKDHDAANDAFQESLRIRRHLSSKSSSHSPGGSNIPINPHTQHIAQALSHIGLLYFDIGELLAAVTAFEEVLVIHRNVQQMQQEQVVVGGGGAVVEQGGLNANIAETLSNIGTIRSKRKQFDKAIVALEECMMIQTLQFGEEHPTVLNTVDQLAYAYCKYGSHENAVELYKQMLRAQINKHGATHIECARTLGKMSIVHEKQKNYCAALECTGEVLAIQRRHLDYNHPDLLATKKAFARMEKNVSAGD